MPLARRTTGFSLIEVLFAVMILTLGLIFVATQFPVALHLARQVSEATMTPIDAHNARIESELQLQRFINSSSFGTVCDASGDKFLNSDGAVHFYCQPNYRLDNEPANLANLEWEKIVIDNMEESSTVGEPFPIEPGYAYVYGNPLDTDIPVHWRIFDPVNSKFFRAEVLGSQVLPSVDPCSMEVLDYLINGVADNNIDNFEDIINELDDDDWDWDEAYFHVVATRTQFQVKLYQCMDAYKAKPSLFRFFIFRIQRQPNQRFAFQDTDNGTDYQLAVPMDTEEDRLFPVPWLIALDRPIDPLDLADFPSTVPTDRFVLNEFTANDTDADNIRKLLRPESILIDANHGEIYRVQEISQLDNDDWLIQLDRKLEDDINKLLQWFWVFPPPIEPEYNDFADDQPVLDLTVTTLQLRE